MPIDSRIALSLQPTDIAGSIAAGMRFHDERQQAQGRKRLGDLLPQVVNGSANDPARQQAMSEIAHIDPRMFMQLTQQQREQASSELDDLAAAVRWADTPDKWSQVQQYYGQQGHDVSQYPFERRENALVELGKIGEYLKGNQQPNQPSSVREYEYAKGQGFQGTFVDYQNQMGSPFAVDNDDGTKTIYPRSMLSGGQQGSAPPPPPPGFQIDGGPAPKASAPF